MDAKYKLLEEENKKLRDELIAVKEHLKKYTAPARSKTFYENHKEEIIKKNKEYIKKNKENLKKPDPEKIKEYNKDYYLKRRAEILEKAKTRVICECGCDVQLSNMNAHKKTRKHLKRVGCVTHVGTD